MSERKRCRDCHDVDRRGFMQTVGGTILATAAAPALFDPRFAHAAPTAQSTAETAVGRFYDSLTAEQKQKICLPFEHPLRTRISANWHITEPVVGDDFYSKQQRAMVDEIVEAVTSQEGYNRLLKQMDDDDGGLQNYSVAVFGEPGSGRFEWELTGRHLTLRADGNTVDKAAFGGPIVYGHGEEDDVNKNLFHYQTQRANEVFQALDAKQAEVALLKEAPAEAAVLLQGKQGKFPGIPVSELSDDQKELVQATLKSLLDPYRKEDVDEAYHVIRDSGGLDALCMAFYQEGDLGSDEEWDIWRIEGPGMVWHFRGYATRARLH